MRNEKAFLAAALMGAAMMLGGCGSTAQETTAAAQTEAAQTEAAQTEAAAPAAETTAAASGETEAAGAETEAAAEESSAASEDTGISAQEDYQKQVLANELAIAQLKPEKPENLGTIELSEADYTGMDIEVTEPTVVTDETVNDYLEELLPNYPAQVYDEVKEGDTAVINFKGEMDGEAFEGGTGENYPLVIGSNSFIPGFEEGLIGARYGETVKLNLTFPEDYHMESLAGKDTVFTVDVMEIRRPRTLEDYDDAAANEITEGEYATAAEFNAYLKEALARNYKAQERQELSYAAVDQIIEKCNIEPTDEAVDWQLDSYILNYSEAMKQSGNGFTLASLIYMYGQTFDEFRESMREQAVNGAKRAMIIYEIGKQQGIEVTDEAMQIFADAYGYDSIEKLKEQGSEDEINFAVLSELVTDYLEQHNTVNYVPAETEAAE